MKWKLGELAGIDVYVHWSFWLLPAWILMSAGGGLSAALSSVIFVFAVFGCVVLHELGHALAARQFGIGTRDITLYPIGGVASLERLPKNPVKELVIALAGPAVNVAIAGAIFLGAILIGAGYHTSLLSLAGGSFLVNLMWVNVALVVFNLLPAFPMDGGRVFRAFLAMQLPYAKATAIAARVGQGIAVLLGLIGLFSSSTLVLVAAFVFLAAQAELAMVRSSGMGWSHAEPHVQSWVSPYRAPVNDEGIVWLSDVCTRPGGGIVVRISTWPPNRSS
jgi:Zn-dependent protease